MSLLSYLLSPLSLLLSLTTATGIFVHDMHIDKFTVTALAAPVAVASYEASTKAIDFGGNAHTHVERVSLSQAVNDLKSDNPRIQPRGHSDKKYLAQKNMGFGHDPLEGYQFPLS